MTTLQKTLTIAFFTAFLTACGDKDAADTAAVQNNGAAQTTKEETQAQATDAVTEVKETVETAAEVPTAENEEATEVEVTEETEKK